MPSPDRLRIRLTGQDPAALAGVLETLGHAVTAEGEADLVLAVLPQDDPAPTAEEAGDLARSLGAPLVLLADRPGRDLARLVRGAHPAAMLPLAVEPDWLAAALETVCGQSEEASRASRAEDRRRRTLTEKLRDGLLRLDLDGRVLDINDAMPAMLGYDRKELLGRDAGELWPQARRRRVVELLREEVPARGHSDLYRTEYLTKDGGVLEVEQISFLDRDAAGRPTGTCSIVRPLSGDRQARDALAASEEKFRALVEHVNDWVWEVDRRGVYTYASPRVKDLLGYEPAEVVGRPWSDFVSTTEAARLTREYRHLASERLPLKGLERICRHKSGQPVLLESSAMPVLDARGGLAGYIGVDRDITESMRVQVEIRRLNKELQEKAARSEEKYRTLFEQANDAIFIVDPETRRLLEFNQTAASQLGYTREELAGLTYDDIAAPMPPDQFQEVMRELKGQGLATFERVHRKKDGDLLPVEICVQEVRLGPQTVWQGIVRDITQRRKAEESLRQIQKLTRSTLDALSANIAILDQRGVILDCNRSWKEFARANGDIDAQVGVNYLEICDTARGPGIRTATHAARGIRAVLAGRLEHFSQEYPCHSPDEKRWFEMRVTRFDDLSGPRVVVAHENVTQSHLARLTLQRQHDFLDTLIEAIPNPVFYKNRQGIYTGCNKSFEAFLGRPRERIIGKTVYDLSPRDLADIYFREDEALFRAGGTQQYESRAIGADGTPREVVFNKAAIPGPDGNPAGLVGVISDITERKRSEEAMAWRSQVDSSLAQLSGALLSSASLEEVSVIILERAQELTGSRVGYVGYIDANTGHLVAPAMTAGVWDSCEVAGKSTVFEERCGLWGWVLDQRRPLLSNDPAADPRSEGTPKGHVPIRRFLSVPALMGDVLLGQIALANPARDYEQRDLEALERMASLWALAVHRQRERSKLDKRTIELVERIKELNCLYDTARLIENKDLSWQEILDGVAKSIQESWKEPGVASCRVGLYGTEAVKGACDDASACLTSPILVHGREGGFVEVCFDQNFSSMDQSPFIRDERLMIDAVAAHLGKRYERHLAEQALREARDLLEQRVGERTRELAGANQELMDYRLAVEGVEEMIAVLDRGLVCRMANRSLLGKRGLSRQEALGAHASEVLGLEAFELLRDPMMLCLDGQTVQHTLELDYPGSGRRTILVHFYPLGNEAGEVDRLVAVFNDVTETKKMERQLMQSEKLASLGLLVSGIAHEINNPNNFISFNLPILREYLEQIIPAMDELAARGPDLEILGMSYREFRDDLFELVDNMQHGSERINSTVSGLREFSRGDDMDQRRLVGPGEVVEKAVALCQGKIKGLVRSFEVRVAPDLPLIDTNPHSLEQVLINLLINAAQAGDKPDSRVRLLVERTDPGTGEVVFRIEDNGLGMEPETLNRIFDPFYTTKKPGEGTGLGLYICHNLVQSLGGRIEVESSPGRGSTFRLVLPAGPEFRGIAAG